MIRQNNVSTKTGQLQMLAVFFHAYCVGERSSRRIGLSFPPERGGLGYAARSLVVAARAACS